MVVVQDLWQRVGEKWSNSRYDADRLKVRCAREQRHRGFSSEQVEGWTCHQLRWARLGKEETSATSSEVRDAYYTFKARISSRQLDTSIRSSGEMACGIHLRATSMQMILAMRLDKVP